MNEKKKLEIEGLMKANARQIKDDRLFPSQEKALNQLSDWYYSDELFCTLEGYAGTGKTYTLQYFINHVANERSLTVTAPTHKALRVLEASVGRKGKTLQSLHGLKPNTDLSSFDIENPQFDTLNPSTIQNYHLVIIDECSMINTDLFLLNEQRAKEFNVKILYVGDSLQLPPVKETISPTFAAVKNKVILTEIVRQEEGNPLLELFTHIRYDILNGKNTFLNYIVKNRVAMREGVGYEIKPIADFKDTLINEFKSSDFTSNIDYFRMACHTNDAVTVWNGFIRNSFIGAGAPMIHIDDLLLSYKTIVDEFKEAIVMNSEDYIIHDIRDYVSDEGFKTFAINLKSMYDGRITQPFLLLDHTHESYQKFINSLNWFHERAPHEKGGWYSYFKFKNRFLTTRDIILPKSKKKVGKDIDYGYALTVHKLQGSTFDNIAIDLTDIVFYNDKFGRRHEYEMTQRNKLIYVALSRAKNRAIIKY